MADYVIPDPEPKEIDEKLSIELRHLSENAVLRGHPSDERAVRQLPLLPGEHRRDLVLLAPEAADPGRGRLVVPVVGEDPGVIDHRESHQPYDAAMTYRVVVWGTGNVGRPAIRAVAAHADLELVGVVVSNPAKVGTDAGELAFVDPLGRGRRPTT